MTCPGAVPNARIRGGYPAWSAAQATSHDRGRRLVRLQPTKALAREEQDARRSAGHEQRAGRLVLGDDDPG
jgi:hypothetical protein